MTGASLVMIRTSLRVTGAESQLHQNGHKFYQKTVKTSAKCVFLTNFGVFLMFFVATDKSANKYKSRHLQNTFCKISTLIIFCAEKGIFSQKVRSFDSLTLAQDDMSVKQTLSG